MVRGLPEHPSSYLSLPILFSPTGKNRNTAVNRLITLDSLEATNVLANIILRKCSFGSLVLLTGPMGVGKTTLVQHLAVQLDSKARVTSPTYTLIHEYPTSSGVLTHIDAYQLPGSESLMRLGLDDYLEKSRLVVVEWGEELRKLYPEAIHVDLTFQKGIRIAQFSIKKPTQRRASK